MCQVPTIPFEKQTKSFFSEFSERIYNFEETQKSIQDIIGDVYCQTSPNEKCLCLSTNKTSRFDDCKNCNACSHVLVIHFEGVKSTFMFFGGDCTHCFARKTSCDYEKRSPSTVAKKFMRQLQSTTPEPVPKKQKSFHLRQNRVDTSMIDTVN